MQNFEIGILPSSSCFSFSPAIQTQKLFYYHTWCGHFYCTDEYYVKRETYPPLLLVYVCSGSFHVELGRKTYTATAGQVVFFDCAQPHHYYTTEQSEFYYLHFDGPQAHELCHYINKSSGVVIDSANNADIEQALAEMLHFYENGNSESVFATSGRIYHLLTLLDNPLVSPRLKKNDDSISRAISHIRAHVGQKITLQELADISGLSVYYFSHLFKEMTGQSPNEFIIHSRIDQAKTLLACTNYPIAEIARQVGYPNSGNLITHFTQRVGCPPMQFRKKNRIGQADPQLP